MKVKMKVEVSGTRDGQPWPKRGEVLELPDADGAQLCAGGLAEPLPDDHVEKAVPDTGGVETRADEPPDPAAVRAWAAENDVKVAAKGKVPDDVVAAYLNSKA